VPNATAFQQSRQQEENKMTQSRNEYLGHFTVHPAADNFPLLEGKDYGELKAAIAARGLSVPIVKKGNVILDGRNRLRACEELGVEPQFIEYDGNDEVGLIVSMNLLRRHLTDDQRVAILAKLRGLQLSKEAARRKHGGVPVKSPQGRVREQIAREAKVGEHKARSALIAVRHAPDILDEVIAGNVKLSDARRVTETRAPKKSRPKAELPLEQRVKKAFLNFMLKFAVTDYREVRRILWAILETPTSETSRDLQPI
jgi:ParB-like chromosome segregation protein Spo0J